MDDVTRILLVVTGDLELLGLARALTKLFPTAYFETTMTVGITGPEGRALQAPNPALADAKGVEIVDELLGAPIPRTRGEPGFDYAIALDDVELVNEPEDGSAGDSGVAVILAHMAMSVDLVLGRSSASHEVEQIPKGRAKRDFRFHGVDDRRKFLRERCSFHLLRPMVEALFFGDLAVVRAAIIQAGASSKIGLDPTTRDIEAFRVDDEGYLSRPVGWIPEGQARVASWATKNRRRHPKHYLQYLLDPTGTVRRPYRETEEGTKMLAALDWGRMLAPAGHARMVRAFLRDIADMVDAPAPKGECHPLVRPVSGGRLRNLA